MKKKLLINGNEVEVELLKSDNSQVTFNLNGKTWSFVPGNDEAIYGVNGNTKTRYALSSAKIPNATLAAVGTHNVKIEDASVSKSKGAAAAGAMVSPMPGKVLKVFKKAGDNVKAGETVLVMEAMKMEHAIKASQDGTISKISHAEGEQVAGGVLLVEMEAN